MVYVSYSYVIAYWLTYWKYVSIRSVCVSRINATKMMAWMKGHEPDFSKTQGQKIRFAIKPIWVRALKLIFSQVYITRPCLQFYRPPKFSRIFCFWEFRISDFRFASFTGQILAWTEKIWNTKFSKRKKSRNFGRPAEL